MTVLISTQPSHWKNSRTILHEAVLVEQSFELLEAYC